MMPSLSKFIYPFCPTYIHMLIPFKAPWLEIRRHVIVWLPEKIFGCYSQIATATETSGHSYPCIKIYYKLMKMWVFRRASNTVELLESNSLRIDI
ncbi:hypothetical protein NPIL_271331 [Nephila pilipes]|uniref:Uncharacterized protein n=1 Tax=Nephila pilipes TaxID=299642 RepID=A0A8X6TZR1_NEPPI|nr:hypothetical protein NPIL_271331 [Nephila pilipes]